MHLYIISALILLMLSNPGLAVEASGPDSKELSGKAEPVGPDGETGKSIRPHLDAGFIYYNDTDDNRTVKYALSCGSGLGRLKVDLNYQHIEASDPVLRKDAEVLFLKIHSKPVEALDMTADLGLTVPGRDGAVVTGSLSADFKLLDGTIGISGGSTVLTETAQLLKNKIQVSGANVRFTQSIVKGLTVSGSYYYKDYSDDNSSDDIQLSARYLAYDKGPALSIGYRLRYLNFDRQSKGGYFDPEGFISHQIFGYLYYEKGRTYFEAEPYTGHQAFRRNRTKVSDFFIGGYGALGQRLTRHIWSEINAEGGNYSVEMVAGFRYYAVGLRLRFLL
jgi:hypothetical protein